MEVGVREAKSHLSRLISAAERGQKVYVLRHGKRVAEIVSVREKRKDKTKPPGYGMFKDQLIDLSPEEEAEAKRLDRLDMERWLNGE